MRTSLLAALAVCLSFAACGDSKEGPKASPDSPKNASGVAEDVAKAKAAAGTVNGRCPVKPDLLVETDTPTRMYKDPDTGKELKIGFCCTKCPKEFDKDAKKFVDRMKAEPAKYGYAP